MFDIEEVFLVSATLVPYDGLREVGMDAPVPNVIGIGQRVADTPLM